MEEVWPFYDNTPSKRGEWIAHMHTQKEGCCTPGDRGIHTIVDAHIANSNSFTLVIINLQMEQLALGLLKL